MPVSVAVEILGLKELEAGMAAAPGAMREANLVAMGESVLLVEGEVKGRTPRRTGRLFSSIGHMVEVGAMGTIGRVGTNVNYAPIVEEGSRAHVILPRNKQALSWPGGSHPVRRVNHPGTKGRHMFRETAAFAGPEVRARFAAAARRVLDSIKGT